MLLYNYVPSWFWGDAILAACYLINRMFSLVLNNQLPHSILFPQNIFTCYLINSMFSFVLNNQLPHSILFPQKHFRVFGCTCFVHDLTPRSNVFSSATFVYSTYLWLYIFSRDISFFETRPIFSSTPDKSKSLTPSLPFAHMNRGLVHHPIPRTHPQLCWTLLLLFLLHQSCPLSYIKVTVPFKILIICLLFELSSLIYTTLSLCGFLGLCVYSQNYR